MLTSLLFLGGAAAALTFVGISIFLRWASKREILDLPNERSLHDRPVPRGGGLPLLATCCLLLAALWWFERPFPGLPLAVFLTAALLVALVGWLDDLYTLSAAPRLAAHLLAGLLVVLFFGHWSTIEVPALGALPLGPAGLPVTLLWIVGLTNAYNFMDGIDGIAAVQTIVAGIGWALLAGDAGIPLVGALGVLLAGSGLGFLKHNWSPSKIFMGDVGSVFLGFSFAAMTVIAGTKSPNLIYAGALLLAPFLFDTALTFLRRLGRAENIFSAHRSHLYQRLVQAGCSHAFVTSWYGILATATAAAAVLWVGRGDRFANFALVVPALVCCGLWTLVALRERQKAPGA